MADKAESLIDQVATTLGESTAGAIVGLITGGPVGAALGAASPAITLPLRRVFNDVLERVLSNREQFRIGTAAYFAAKRIESRIKSGDKPRKDGFLDQDASGRTPADEIFEGVLMKCKNEHEEKKCRYLGYFFANVAFTAEVSPADANNLIEIAEGLTYRGLVILALVARAKDLGLNFPWGTLSFKNQREKNSILLHELRAMEGLIHGVGNTENPPEITRLGALVYELMNLNEVPLDEIKAVAEFIRQSSGPSS